eukprot:365962-Chlamydomonas_euryale.AAC.6
MIASRAAGGTERGKDPLQAPLRSRILQSMAIGRLVPMGRLVHMGGLPTAWKLADVAIYTRQSAKRCETQRRPEAAPDSCERSA